MALEKLILPLLFFPLGLIAWTGVCLAGNYAKAKSTGLPVTVRFISPHGVLWMMFSPFILKLLSAMPFTESFISTYRRGWEARVRCRPHVEMGDMFMICTPIGNWLKIGTAELTAEILKRRDDFKRNMQAFEVLNIYGKNLITTDGEDWNRHRKVAAASFNERNNELVWRESLKESQQMLNFWLDRSPQPIRTWAEDCRIFTLNVLAAALFDKSYPFESREESKARQSGIDDVAFGYRDSLSTMLQRMVPILVFGEKTLREAWWMPASVKKAGYAVSNFRTYVTDLINEERQLLAEGKQNSPNLVTNLVRACEENDGSLRTEQIHADKSKFGSRRSILTKDEIVSDLFIFAFAGNDTTALTLSYILAEMSAHPAIQEWISEEIRHYLSEANIDTWNYANFAVLKRCRAVVYETLRTTHPATVILKTTGGAPRTIHHNGVDHVIPAHTNVDINIPGVQTHPRHWGEDSLIWNPKRFITTSSPNSAHFEDEVLPPDTSPAFISWSVGRNVCPGKRFSQVELVAVLAILFRDYTLEPVPHIGESLDQARSRVAHLAQENLEHFFLMEIRETEKIGLKWVKRND